LACYANKNELGIGVPENDCAKNKLEKNTHSGWDQKFKKIFKCINKHWLLCNSPLVLISAVFIAIKIVFPLVFRGAFVDEYLHLTAAKDLFLNHAIPTIHQHVPYTRGIVVSEIIALAFKLFSPSILIAKLTIALIAIINYFLLLKIIIKLGISKNNAIIILFFYTVCPWVIINHFYIRMYIFQETFFLLITYLYLKFRESKKIYSLIIFFLVSIAQFFLINDDGSLFLILYSLILTTMFFLRKSLSELFSQKNKLLRKLFQSTKIKSIILLAILACAFSNSAFLKKFNILFSGQVSYTSGIKYEQIFLNTNLVFVLMIVFSSVLLYVYKKRSVIFEICLAFSALFFLHLFSSKDFQMIRVINYLMPLYFVFAIYPLDYFKKIFNSSLVKYLILLVMIIAVFKSYPANFLNAPGIATELFYKDYDKAFSFVRNNCDKNNIFYLTSGPFVADFYDTNARFSYIVNKNLITNPIYKDGLDGSFFTTYNNHPVITSDEVLIKEITKLNNYCVLTGSDMKEDYNFLSPETYEKLKSSSSVFNLSGLILFYK